MRRKLSKKQIKVLDELFGLQPILNEEQVLKQNDVKVKVYREWLKREVFKKEYAARMEAILRQNRLLINRCASEAARKLLGLTASGNAETARKACLDIIGRTNGDSGEKRHKCTRGKGR